MLLSCRRISTVLTLLAAGWAADTSNKSVSPYAGQSGLSSSAWGRQQSLRATARRNAKKKKKQKKSRKGEKKRRKGGNNSKMTKEKYTKKSKKQSKSGKKSKSGKQSKIRKKSKSGKQSKGGEEETKVCTLEYTGNVVVTTSYDVLSIDGVQWENIDFIVSTVSHKTILQLSVPYEFDREKTTLSDTVESIPRMEPTNTLIYRRVFHIDLAPLLPKCSNGVAPFLEMSIPRSVQELCVSGTCHPVLCPLTLPETIRVDNRRSDFSFAPSNHPLFFPESKDCAITKPESWDEYITQYFGADALTMNPPELLYYIDPDLDGVSNIVEYYGINPMNVSAAEEFLKLNNATQAAETTLGRRQRRLLLIPLTATNPLAFDTDKDLLNDGFELGFGLNPLVVNDINEDLDGDGLTTFQEQRLGTDPSKPDTDGDGASDANEKDQGSDPNDDRDSTPTEDKVEVMLTVGDPSGSHSERYNMVVGTVTHQAPQFGVVNSDTYTFPTGEYTVTVVHVASNLPSPDYDYYAAIAGTDVPADMKITIEDPQGILGSHYESSYDFASGKSATLKIEKTCEEAEEQDDECACHKSCKDCQASNKCFWTQDAEKPTGSCKAFDGKPQDRELCSCDKCESWYQKEIKENDWVKELPQCPCTVESNLFGTDIRPKNDDGISWSDDWACSENGLNPIQIGVDCKYHKGGPGEPDATACIRATKTVGGKERSQQCCYNEPSNRNYVFLKPGLLSAGTPDKSTSKLFGETHGEADVDTYNWCCKECTEAGSCVKYIGSKEYDTDGKQTKPGARSDPRGCKDAAASS